MLKENAGGSSSEGNVDQCCTWIQMDIAVEASLPGCAKVVGPI